MNAVLNPADLLPTKGPMSPALAIMLNDVLFERAKLIAKYLSESDGFVPPHLLGKPQACFAVVTRAMTWKLDPYAVAQSTYQTPGGRVGYEGKLYQAILENSGLIQGGVTFEHYGTVTVKLKDGRVAKFRSTDPGLVAVFAAGAVETDRKDWSAVQGKFEIRKSDKGKDFAVPTWKRPEAEGLGVIVRATVAGEAKPRELDFELIQAFPLNSTLWATDPKTQICYTAIRRFASVRVPGIFIGLPVERDDDPAEYAIDVTPAAAAPARPTRDQFRGGGGVNLSAEVDEPEPYELVNEHGEVLPPYKWGSDALDHLWRKVEKFGRVVWEFNESLIERLRQEDKVERVHEALEECYQRFVLDREAKEAKPGAADAGTTATATAQASDGGQTMPDPSAEEDDFPGTKPSGSTSQPDSDDTDRRYDALVTKLGACRSLAEVDAFPDANATELRRIISERKDLGNDWARQFAAAKERFTASGKMSAPKAKNDTTSSGGMGSLV